MKEVQRLEKKKENVKKRDKLLVAVVLTLVISIDMIQTSMLAPILPHIPTIVPFFGVVLLGLRFLYIKQYTFTFLLFAPLFLAGCLIYYKTGNLNALMYLFLIIFLYKADFESVLKQCVGISLFFVVLIILLSMMGVILNSQFVQSRAAGVVVRNSFGFIYPTEFASHCFYLFTALSYLLRKKFIFLRTLSGVALATFIIVYCDARLNALSILVATGVFFYFYYRKHIKLFLKSMNLEKMFVSIELYSNVSIKSHSHKLVNMSIFRAGALLLWESIIPIE